MLTTPRSQLVEKIITSPEGVQFLATFLVYEETGRVKAKLIKAIPIAIPEEKPLALLTPVFKAKISYEEPSILRTEPILSPFNSILDFTCTKPRAPSLKF